MNDVTRMIRLINTYRSFHGLRPLVSYAPLMVSSRRRARHITRTGIFSHAGWVHAISRVIRRWRRIGENLAEGYSSAESAMWALENSPAHDANLRGDYNRIGVARVGDVWVQHFLKL